MCKTYEQGIAIYGWQWAACFCYRCHLGFARLPPVPCPNPVPCPSPRPPSCPCPDYCGSATTIATLTVARCPIMPQSLCCSMCACALCSAVLFQKCQETGETIKSLKYGKCLETGETTKSLEIMTLIKCLSRRLVLVLRR